MRIIKVTKKIFSAEKLRLLKNEQASIDHVSTMIDTETLIYSEGKIVAIYKKVDFDTKEIRQACLQLKFDVQIRSSGLRSETVNLNASPRRAHLDNKCWLSKLRRSNPTLHKVFEATARELSKGYRKYFKRRFANQVKATYSGSKKVHEVYRISGTPYTGGVANKNSALPYHFDQSNTDDGISCMLILKQGIAGGELILPELNIGFACQDNYMLLFDGKAYLHGVTQLIKTTSGKGHRYTIVFYNNSGMELCLPPEEEEIHYQSHLEKQSEKKRNKKNKK